MFYTAGCDDVEYVQEIRRKIVIKHADGREATTYEPEPVNGQQGFELDTTNPGGVTYSGSLAPVPAAINLAGPSSPGGARAPVGAHVTVTETMKMWVKCHGVYRLSWTWGDKSEFDVGSGSSVLNFQVTPDPSKPVPTVQHEGDFDRELADLLVLTGGR